MIAGQREQIGPESMALREGIKVSIPLLLNAKLAYEGSKGTPYR